MFSNYPYNMIPMQQQYQPYQYPQYQQYQQPKQNTVQNGINGRFVNSSNEIAVNEIPMDGNASFFPVVGDDTIIAKKWNANGTIETLVYRLDKDIPDQNANKSSMLSFESLESALKALQSGLYERIDALERRLPYVEPVNDTKPAAK